jgi:hypothetical protein
MGTSLRRAALTAATGATFAVLALPAAAHAAADVTVNPTAVAPGGRFTLAAFCGAAATSASVGGTPIGGPSEITLNPFTSGGPGAFNAELTVAATVLPGTYQLNVMCSDGETGSGTLVVSPTGAPAGGGGSTSQGPSRALLGAGGGLLAVSGIGTFVMLRRRYRGHHSA